uniref:Midnolin-like n=1 Tax=Petromyzon marinus TaxID=7757 RepID=A0AAJ7UKN6_PETMA|nr:midnolin-like [Petromyzon marinus]
MDLDGSSGVAENGDESNAQTPLSPLRVFLESTLAARGGGEGGGGGDGGRVLLMVEPGESVAGLRARVARALQRPHASGSTDFHLLLDRTRLLDGRRSVHEAGLRNGSTLTVVPALNSGLKAARPKAENSIMQALQSLTDSQVSDFLCGRSPLTLTLTTLAGSLSFVQLQLAARPTRGGRRGGGHEGSRRGGGHVTSEEATQATCSGASLDSLHQLYPGCFSGIFSGSLPPSTCGHRRGGGGGGGVPRQEEVAVVYRILLDLLAASRAQRSHNNNNNSGHNNRGHNNNNNSSHHSDDARTPRASSKATPAWDGSRAAETHGIVGGCRGLPQHQHPQHQHPQHPQHPQHQHPQHPQHPQHHCHHHQQHHHHQEQQQQQLEESAVNATTRSKLQAVRLLLQRRRERRALRAPYHGNGGGGRRRRGDHPPAAATAVATATAVAAAGGESPPESPRYDARCYAAA